MRTRLNRSATHPIAAALAVFLLASVHARANNGEVIRLASTTSTDDSGLFAHILPRFTRATGITVRVIAVGTGQALRIARRGDADVLLVHHRPSEEAFVRAGYGVRRYSVMYNDFVLVGPGGDPAGARSAKSISGALRRIFAARSNFASRGDESGTHKRERALWKAAGLRPEPRVHRWYRDIGSGMGATLNFAAATDSYALVDRGTWLTFANKRTLRVIYEGGTALRNVYGVILVNPKRHPHVRAAAGQKFIDWLTGAGGQQAVASFRVQGQVLFRPIAGAR